MRFINTKSYYFWIGVLVLILLILWGFWGGKNYNVVGLDPLNPPNISRADSKSNFRSSKVDKVDRVDKVGNEEKRTNDRENRIKKNTKDNDNDKTPPENIGISASQNKKDHSHFVTKNNLADICFSEVDPEEGTNASPRQEKEREEKEREEKEKEKEEKEQVPIPEKRTIIHTLPKFYQRKAQENKPDGKFPSYHPRRTFRSEGERICCTIMEEIYGVPFTTVRPDWLRNPETGRNLEIDCYNDDLKLGLEFNGKQHTVYPNWTGQTYEQFIQQVRRDQLKVELCDRHGVYLITVPHTVAKDKIRDFIVYRLPESRMKRMQEGITDL